MLFFNAQSVRFKESWIFITVQTSNIFYEMSFYKICDVCTVINVPLTEGFGCSNMFFVLTLVIIDISCQACHGYSTFAVVQHCHLDTYLWVKGHDDVFGQATFSLKIFRPTQLVGRPIISHIKLALYNAISPFPDPPTRSPGGVREAGTSLGLLAMGSEPASVSTGSGEAPPTSVAVDPPDKHRHTRGNFFITHLKGHTLQHCSQFMLKLFWWLHCVFMEPVQLHLIKEYWMDKFLFDVPDIQSILKDPHWLITNVHYFEADRTQMINDGTAILPKLMLI